MMLEIYSINKESFLNILENIKNESSSEKIKMTLYKTGIEIQFDNSLKIHRLSIPTKEINSYRRRTYLKSGEEIQILFQFDNLCKIESSIKKNNNKSIIILQYWSEISELSLWFPANFGDLIPISQIKVEEIGSFYKRYQENKKNELSSNNCHRRHRK